MQVRVRLFAALREAAGRGELAWDLPEGATVERLLAELCAAMPALQVGVGRARVAVNRSYAAADTRLTEGDEVALIPPVSGG